MDLILFIVSGNQWDVCCCWVRNVSAFTFEIRTGRGDEGGWVGDVRVGVLKYKELLEEKRILGVYGTKTVSCFETTRRWDVMTLMPFITRNLYFSNGFRSTDFVHMFFATTWVLQTRSAIPRVSLSPLFVNGRLLSFLLICWKIT